MAQFDIFEVEFKGSGSQKELSVEIDNPENMDLYDNPSHGKVPSNVEVVESGHSPTRELWVHADNYHLTITLNSGSDDNPLYVTNTEFYDQGSNPRYVDIIIALLEEGDRKAKRVRRRASMVFE